MKLVSTFPGNSKRINLQLASFAGGPALATIAFIGGGEILGDGGDTEQTSSLSRVESRSVGLANVPDFGFVAADHSTFKQSVLASRSINPVMDVPDFGLVAADYSAFGQSVIASQGFTNEASGTQIIDPHLGNGVESISVIESDYLQ